MPQGLKTIILEKGIRKCGRSVNNDITKIVKDFKLPHQNPEKPYEGLGGVDIAVLARKMKLIPRRRQSKLDDLVRILLNRTFNKDQEIRCGDWHSPLGREQINYAALDAYAGLMIYHAINKFLPPGAPVTEITAGMPVEVHLGASDNSAIIARGTMVDLRGGTCGGVTVGPKQCVVQISIIEQPGAKLTLHRRALKDWPSGPFKAVVHLSHLRKSVPLDVAERAMLVYPPAPPPNPTPQEPRFLPERPDDEDEVGESLEDILNAAEERPTSPVSPTETLSPTDSDTGETYSNDCFQGIRRVLDDPYHIMARIKCARKHGAALAFAWAFRDALFVPDPVIKARIIEVLAARNPSTTYEEVLAKNPKWLFQRLPRRIPPPNELYPVIKELFDTYGHLIDAATGKPLFDEQVWQRAKGVLQAIRDGYVSDPADVELYVKESVDSEGLDKYRCLRGTNSVEGGCHQNLIRIFQCFNASPQIATCLLAEYVLRHNLNVVSWNATGRSFNLHYDIALTSQLLQMYDELDISPSPWLKGSVNLNAYADTAEKQFILPIADNLKEAYGIEDFVATTRENEDDEENEEEERGEDEDEAALMNDQFVWMAKRQNIKYPALPVFTAEENRLFREIVSDNIGREQLKEVTRTWNARANGTTIFYKLPEHLESHLSTRKRVVNNQQTLFRSMESRESFDAYRIADVRATANVLTRCITSLPPLPEPPAVSLPTPPPSASLENVSEPPTTSMHITTSTTVNAVSVTPPSSTPQSDPVPGADEPMPDATAVQSGASVRKHRKAKKCRACRDNGCSVEEQEACDGSSGGFCPNRPMKPRKNGKIRRTSPPEPLGQP